MASSTGVNIPNSTEFPYPNMSLSMVDIANLPEPTEAELQSMTGRLGSKIVKFEEGCNPEIRQRCISVTALMSTGVFSIIAISFGVSFSVAFQSLVPIGIAVGLIALVAIVAAAILSQTYKSHYLEIPEERESIVKQIGIHGTYDTITRDFTTEEVIGYRLLDGIFRPWAGETHRIKKYAQFENLVNKKAREAKENALPKAENTPPAQPQIVVEAPQSTVTPTTYTPLEEYTQTPAASFDAIPMPTPSAPPENE